MERVLEYAWLIPLFPLAGAILNGLLGKRLGKAFVSWVGVGSVALAFVWSVAVFGGLWRVPGRLFTEDLFAWIPMGTPAGGGFSGSFEAPVGYLLDPLSSVMILVVTGVGLLIHIYSIGYMGHDPDYSRYFAYLNLFAAAMLTLVMANNFLLMFVGWEGVGLCSYLLIGFWYEKPSAAAAGKKAFLVNRVGDFGFVLGMLCLFSVFGTLDFVRINQSAHAFHQAGILTTGMATVIALLLFVGATGKSAQLPLWVWLPDAMEGPTPVSALIHAATMVTAGVYMIARTNAIYALAPVASGVVAVVGVLTALFAATIALTQYDLKRVLAYSTISQLGLMFLAVGVGAYTAGIFHLVTHAFFKGLLFLAAGSVMHALGNKIDLREMGQLRRHLPATHAAFLVGWLAIAGVPPLAGWWSKDEILTEAFGTKLHLWWAPGPVLYAAGLAVTFLTAAYMSRAYYLAFHSDHRVDPHTRQHLHESPRVMTAPLWILAVLSAIAGVLLAGPVLAGRESFIAAYLEPVWAPARHILGEEAAHHSDPGRLLLFMLVATAVAAAGILWAARSYWKTAFATPEPAERQLRGLWQFFAQKWYIEQAYHALFVTRGMRLAAYLAGPVDQGRIDRAVNGVGAAIERIGEGARRVQAGYVRGYAFSILIGVVALVAFFAIR